MPNVHFLAILDMIWLDLIPEHAYHLQVGVEIGLRAKVTTPSYLFLESTYMHVYKDVG